MGDSPSLSAASESKSGEKSLLDVIQARFDAGGGRESLTRMLYVGTIPKTATKHDVCNMHKDFLIEYNAEVSGLMLLQPASFLNLVEALPDVINALLRHLQLDMESATPTVASIRVLACSEDCPNPVFASWSYRSINMPSGVFVFVCVVAGLLCLLCVCGCV